MLILFLFVRYRKCFVCSTKNRPPSSYPHTTHVQLGKLFSFVTEVTIVWIICTKHSEANYENLFLDGSRYKTRRARQEGGYEASAGAVGIGGMGAAMMSSPSSSQGSNPLPSPRRVAVPVLVRDGQRCPEGVDMGAYLNAAAHYPAGLPPPDARWWS